MLTPLASVTEVWREIELMVAKSAGKQRKVAERDATVRSADFQTQRSRMTRRGNAPLPEHLDSPTNPL